MEARIKIRDLPSQNSVLKPLDDRIGLFPSGPMNFSFLSIDWQKYSGECPILA